jgi:hypothetical protein
LKKPFELALWMVMTLWQLMTRECGKLLFTLGNKLNLYFLTIPISKLPKEQYCWRIVSFLQSHCSQRHLKCNFLSGKLFSLISFVNANLIQNFFWKLFYNVKMIINPMVTCTKKLFCEKVENSEKSSEASKIQNGQFEKRRFRDSISPSSGPT